MANLWGHFLVSDSIMSQLSSFWSVFCLLLSNIPKPIKLASNIYYKNVLFRFYKFLVKYKNKGSLDKYHHSNLTLTDNNLFAWKQYNPNWNTTIIFFCFFLFLLNYIYILFLYNDYFVILFIYRIYVHCLWI